MLVEIGPFPISLSPSSLPLSFPSALIDTPLIFAANQRQCGPSLVLVRRCYLPSGVCQGRHRVAKMRMRLTHFGNEGQIRRDEVAVAVQG